MIRCLVVDDEPLARRLLASFVARVPFLQLVDTCASAFEAMAVLAREPVDLLFLDIQMPDLTGVEFVRTLRPAAQVVFTTAYEQYAVEGFHLHAVDYLLKPIPFERFVLAAQRTRERLMPGGVLPSATASAGSAEDFIFVKADYQTQRVWLREIRFLEGLKDYVKIVTDAPRPILTLNTLKNFEEKLPAADFVRVHRSFIVAWRWIDSVRKNRIYIGALDIPVGDAYADAFNQAVEARNPKMS